VGPKRDFRAEIASTILAMPRVIGSGLSSAMLLELIHRGKAPAAILLGEAAAITALGVLVARGGQIEEPIRHQPSNGLVRLRGGGHDAEDFCRLLKSR
jgi:predicted aconitase with swiveling domain